MKNLGPKSRSWLAAVGIHTLEDLHSMGALDAYWLIKQHGYPASLNLLYAMEGALRDCHWAKLPAEVKTALQQAVLAPAKMPVDQGPR